MLFTSNGCMLKAKGSIQVNTDVSNLTYYIFRHDNRKKSVILLQSPIINNFLIKKTVSKQGQTFTLLKFNIVRKDVCLLTLAYTSNLKFLSNLSKNY